LPVYGATNVATTLTAFVPCPAATTVSAWLADPPTDHSHCAVFTSTPRCISFLTPPGAESVYVSPIVTWVLFGATAPSAKAWCSVPLKMRNSAPNNSAATISPVAAAARATLARGIGGMIRH